ncbi:histidine kinase [Mesorhizobium sp. NBSH29]|uniref:CHASE domain-containing protein n=1 Tax=Mesorhizobium sp. NBSH29 TaxID=2654249 RepID=UPI0018969CDF|nr:CHASE domain-containing protein [Mesorhizobium sp. NBSH29]QPC88485.1 histidine kinase [Mesorhizobium sp. NBSH29]
MKKLFPIIVFLSVALASMVMAGYAYFASQEAGRIKFEAAADDALARIDGRIGLHLSLLRATHAFMKARIGAPSYDEFRTFVNGLDFDSTYTGMRGIGIVRPLPPGTEAVAVDEIRQNYGFLRKIWPSSEAEWLAPLTAFEPTTDVATATLGYDMFSDASRKPAIEAAMKTPGAHATGIVELGKTTGGPVYPGFLVFLRIDPGAAETAAIETAPAGLLYAVFRANELFGAALGQTPLLPVNVEVYDGEPADGHLLFRSQAIPAKGFESSHLVTRHLEVADQTWTVLMRPTNGFAAPSSPLIPLSLGLFGLFLAIAIAMIAHWQGRAYEAIETLQSATEKSLSERDLMLQEMKHRIKNSLTRVLAMARHTATHSKNIDDFSKSFSARVQAMAASQDMLTRSLWQKADLEALLKTELEQVFGQDLKPGLLSGPAVALDEATTQALGLTIHELATNAMKYGKAGKGAAALEVKWLVSGDPRTLKLTWSERGTKVAKPNKVGFGTKLIDMSICRELGGEIERHYGNGGLKVTIKIPVDSHEAAHRKS